MRSQFRFLALVAVGGVVALSSAHAAPTYNVDSALLRFLPR